MKKEEHPTTPRSRTPPYFSSTNRGGGLDEVHRRLSVSRPQVRTPGLVGMFWRYAMESRREGFRTRYRPSKTLPITHKTGTAEETGSLKPSGTQSDSPRPKNTCKGREVTVCVDT